MALTSTYSAPSKSILVSMLNVSVVKFGVVTKGFMIISFFEVSQTFVKPLFETYYAWRIYNACGKMTPDVGNTD